MNQAVPALDPFHWGASFSKAPDWCSGRRLRPNGVLLRGWGDTSPHMEQPPLTHHYLVLHQGGPKRVTRVTAGATVSADVEADSITLATAGTSHIWNTQGPISFAHLYLCPSAIDDVIRHEFDRDPTQVKLIDGIGHRMPLLAALLHGLENQLKGGESEARLLLDTLVHHILVQLVAECSNAALAVDRPRHAISPGRLARVIDFINANFAEEVGLAELAAIAGSSRYHFSRAFRDATGLPPYRYLINHRVDEAKKMLTAQDLLPICDIARNCGFNSRRQFEIMFLRICGTTPARYRTSRQ